MKWLISVNFIKTGLKSTFVIFLFSISLFNSVNAATDKEIRRLKNAVIKIYTSTAAPDYFTPWRLLGSRQSSGSGALISEDRILTNAHVIADASYIQVQKNGHPKKYIAKVSFVSHAADLAILTVDDKSFFKDLKPLEIGDLPKPLEEVSVFGYPLGGSSLSITKGVLSRVEHQEYAHASSYLLAGQIDAAINPGNSGGPVIVNQKIVGVVMQGFTGGSTESLGYFVPPSVIRHVLQDAKDGVYDGFASLGFQSQKLESPTMKAAYGLKADQSGGLIVNIYNDSLIYGKLQANDVILSINDYDIADDLTIEFSKELRTSYKYAFDQLHMGDTFKVVFARDGKIKTAKIKIKKAPRNYNLVQAEQFDKIPRYYIYGGIVFVPLNMNLIKRWGNWRSAAPVNFVNALNLPSSEDKKELVIALKVLPSDVNLGFHGWSNWIIETVNDQPIKDFKQFCLTLKNNSKPFVRLKDDKGYRIIIDHQQALEKEREILSLYRIPASHSVGLFDK